MDQEAKDRQLRGMEDSRQSKLREGGEFGSIADGHGKEIACVQAAETALTSFFLFW